MKTYQIIAFCASMLVAGQPALAAAATASSGSASTSTSTSTSTSPATAATVPAAKPTPKVHYYIAQATDTKACSIVSKKPDGKTATMVGKYWYATEAAATSAEKHQAACKA